MRLTQVADRLWSFHLPIAPVATPPVVSASGADGRGALQPKRSNIRSLDWHWVWSRWPLLRLHLRRVRSQSQPASAAGYSHLLQNLPGNHPCTGRSTGSSRRHRTVAAQFHARPTQFISQDQIDQAQVELTQVAQNSEKLLNRNADLPPEPRAALHTLAGESWLALDKPDRAQPQFEELEQSGS